jgi:DNA-binding transcriptional ArsR family regulator
MYGVMSRELVREQAMIGMLGALSAEARVARFLVSLADRFAAMGYSSKLFNLRMTRHEIGSYLGLTLETVSRTLSAFNEIGLITVDQRTIGIKDPEALKTLRRLPPSRSRAKQILIYEEPDDDHNPTCHATGDDRPTPGNHRVRAGHCPGQALEQRRPDGQRA